jgi:hypothetical protein
MHARAQRPLSHRSKCAIYDTSCSLRETDGDCLGLTQTRDDWGGKEQRKRAAKEASSRQVGTMRGKGSSTSASVIEARGMKDLDQQLMETATSNTHNFGL